MKTNNYNLQILHHSEVFETRELAVAYLNDYYKPYSLDAEPVMVKYGDTKNPNVILAFGTSDNAPGSFYAIDMTKANEEIAELQSVAGAEKGELESIATTLQEVVKAAGFDVDDNKIKDKITYKPDVTDSVVGSAVSIAEAINLLSKYAQTGFASTALSVEDTNSVRFLYAVNANGGMTLKAEIKVSTDGENDELLFNNNIIGVKDDGIFASANLSYDEVRHQLIFTTSGYKNGKFQDDAVVQKVDLGPHTVLVADNEGKTVKLNIVENTTTNTTTLSADVQLTADEDNILVVKDGKLEVIGTAKNIKYGSTTVAGALYNQGTRLDELDNTVAKAAKSAHVEGGTTDTLITEVTTLADGGAQVVGKVRLGSDNSVVVRNGGLEANITVDVNNATNQLIVTIGNQTITKTLPGVELFQSAVYNDVNEELVISFKTGNSVTIPIHSIIHTWTVENSAASAVTLNKQVVTGGTDKLSADVNLRSTDNLLGKENGMLYVSESVINNKVAVETSRATAAEEALAADIVAEKNRATVAEEKLQTGITEVKDSVVAEKERAVAVENEIKTVADNANATATEAKTIANAATETVNTVADNLATTNANVAAVQHLVDDEVARATAAESATLESAKAYTDTKVLAEANTRASKDVDLENAIAAEVNRASNAEANAVAYTDTKVLAEENARIAKDTELETAIATAAHAASDEATTKADAAQVAAQAYADEKLAVETSRATAAEEALAADVVAEKNRAIAAEEVLAADIAKKIESVTVEKNSDLQYFINVDGVKVGEITIPADQFFKGATYDSNTKVLTLTFNVNKDGVLTDEVVNINISDLVDIYTAGDGVVLTDNVFSVKVNNESEKYLTVSNEGIGIFGIDEAISNGIVVAQAEVAAQLAAVNETLSKKIEKVEVVKNSQSDLQYTLKVDGVDAGEINIPKDQFLKDVSYNTTTKELKFVFETTAGAVTSVIAMADLIDTYTAGNGLTLTDSVFAVRVNEDSEAYLTVSEEGIKLMGIDAALANKANVADVYTKGEIDAKGFATETEVAALSNTVDALQFVTEESDTVRLTMDKQADADYRTLSADVKIKTLTGSDAANIIKSDANGVYATVTLGYDKATNILTFNDGNGAKTFELSNVGIVQEAFYESATKQIVLVLKKSDTETERLEIPVADLVNTWSVENASNNPIVLTKTETENGDVLTANVSILENANNLLTNNNGSLFVDGDANAHTALWGAETVSVQGAINLLKESADKIDSILESLTNLDGDAADLKVALASYKAELESQQVKLEALEGTVSDVKASQTLVNTTVESLATRVTKLENDGVGGGSGASSEEVTALQNDVKDLQDSVKVMNNTISELSDKVDGVVGDVYATKQSVETLSTTVGEHTTRIETLEGTVDALNTTVANLIDFGNYDETIA